MQLADETAPVAGAKRDVQTESGDENEPVPAEEPADSIAFRFDASDGEDATTSPTTEDAPTEAKAVTPESEVDLSAPEYYLNRELSELAFQRRVLHEVTDESNPCSSE